MNLPNKITVSRILLIPIFILLLSYPFDWGSWEIAGTALPVAQVIALLIFAFASATDWLDGYYARKYNLVTNLGKFLDPMADKLLVSAAFILLVAMELAPAWVIIIIISREFAVTGLRLVAAGEGIVLAAGNLGKWKTLFQILAILALLLENIPFENMGIPVADILLYIALLFTIVSGVEYFVKNWHVMTEDSKK
ncbi:CDP-diacylglycerol--glycerol-3-phosphate 3-phosphatidyltransferase [Gracilibacillus halotolerans]|uniref:CDP-diacylglycerol--glycerol-3-phosphate 3-phosphatidyltransferase n=1 Tax=Gracilibacillus halotolerans TaxID=74386 RepID=A0A841RIM0_9BACI|nr:CDP-diacylglycerol--glycerol-3-phosphate 3-phosphatidyltransferase [Gracilibacillus halotolerans]MBB6511503.1 CDP-diacylglycerol--glycerol-3-phosphate 3-phosphatidyltransferase [Gracilibacillus halotolerans]